MTSTATYKVNSKVIVLVTSDDQNVCFFKNTTTIEYYHVNSTSKIFPSLFTYQPGTIIIDCDYLKDEVKDLVRRIRTNSFYNKLKICCLKNASNTKTDDELLTIGVDYLLYRTTTHPGI
jgi:hypothetical protein